MSTATWEKSLLRRSLQTYAAGLGYMAATGLGVFSVFCFYVAAIRGRVSLWEGAVAASGLLALIVVWWVGRRDQADAARKRVDSLTAWVVYLLVCVCLISPAEKGIITQTTDQGSIFLPALLVGLPVILDFLRKQFEARGSRTNEDMVKRAMAEIQEALNRGEAHDRKQALEGFREAVDRLQGKRESSSH